MSNTVSLTALPPPRLNTSDAVNYLLTRHGIRVAELTMKQASTPTAKCWPSLLVSWENFSDEKIIGKDSREAQELLGAVWIHENAELLNVWAEQRLTPVVASTSELTSLLTDVAPNTVAKRARVSALPTSRRTRLPRSTSDRGRGPRASAGHQVRHYSRSGITRG